MATKDTFDNAIMLARENQRRRKEQYLKKYHKTDIAILNALATLGMTEAEAKKFLKPDEKEE